MYYNFNETNIITGYIKELLRDFNLPIYSVYRENKRLHAGKLYIKDSKIYKCITNSKGDLELSPVSEFLFNHKNNEYTKNLIINSSIYDSYTHDYLGDYLRFIRDYKGINLMPLYNCFNTERPVGLDYTVSIERKDETGAYKTPYVYEINSSDSKYNYYIVPAKFDEVYTLSVNAPVTYEISCIIYTGDKVLDISKELSKITYKRVSTSGKRCPYLYSTIVDEDRFTVKGEFGYAANYWKYEPYLKLLLKIPKVAHPAITVLEGNYTNNICGNTLVNKLYLDDSSKNIDAISKLSLLNINTDNSRPFADRLVEYLLGNAISNLENIPQNVGHVQDALLENLSFSIYDEETEKYIEKRLKFKGNYDLWDDFIRINILRKLSSLIDSTNLKKTYYNIYNWKIDGSGSAYEKATQFEYFRPIDEYYDLLGYVDKNTESNLSIPTIVK